MNSPIILINAKNYEKGCGKELIGTLETIRFMNSKHNKQFAIAVNALDLCVACYEFSSDLNIFAQHCDNADFGATTGKIIPKRLKEMGVKGVILNHSENRIENKTQLFETIQKAKDAGLTVVCCAETPEEGKDIKENAFPDFIAIEPPELIGGDISVSTARPEIISDSVDMIGNNILVGAGIKNKKDIDIAIQKGAGGVLLASGIMKAENMIQALEELII